MAASRHNWPKSSRQNSPFWACFNWARYPRCESWPPRMYWYVETEFRVLKWRYSTTIKSIENYEIFAIVTEKLETFSRKSQNYKISSWLFASNLLKILSFFFSKFWVLFFSKFWFFFSKLKKMFLKFFPKLDSKVWEQIWKNKPSRNIYNSYIFLIFQIFEIGRNFGMFSFFPL